MFCALMLIVLCVECFRLRILFLVRHDNTYNGVVRLFNRALSTTAEKRYG